MAKQPKVECRPKRVDKKPGPKTALVKTHKRSTPKELPNTCKK